MAEPCRRGVFVTFEGGEGAGKSTQLRLLGEKLGGKGVDFTVTREPGGTPLAESIRHLLKDYDEDPPNPKSELLLFLAARAQLVESVIRPALKSGRWVVSDRFSDSTFAYQAYGRGLDFKQVGDANAFACGGLEPDITFLLDLDPEAAVSRRRAREAATGIGADRFETAERSFHERLRKGFLEIAAANPGRVKVIDASRTPEEVSGEIWNFLKPII